MTQMFFANCLRNVVATVAMTDGRTMFVLEAADFHPDTYPTLAVAGTQFEDTGLFENMVAFHKVTDLPAFLAKLPALEAAGVYEVA